MTKKKKDKVKKPLKEVIYTIENEEIDIIDPTDKTKPKKKI